MNQSKNQQWQAYLICLASYLFAGLTSTLMSAYLPEVINSLLPSVKNEAEIGRAGAYVNSVSLFGWMIGGFVFGYLSDRFGRKQTLVAATAICGLGTILIYAANHWNLILLFRFITGMGIGGILLITTVYVSEIWPAATRPVALGILAVAFPAGIVASGAVTVLFSDWRLAFLLGLVEIVVAAAMWVRLEESAHWKRESLSGPSAIQINKQEHSKSILHGSIIFGSVLIGLWAIFSWMPTWVQSILPPGDDGQSKRGIVMMLLGFGGIAGGILSGFLIQWLGTRKVLMFTFAGLILMSFLLFKGNREFNWIVYPQTALLALLFGISQGSLSGYIPGLFPTKVRALASGICFNIGRFFTATAVFFVGSMVGFFGGFGNALLSFSTMFFIALVATILYSKQINNQHGIYTTK